ncbi:MAG: NAD(P)/FAD-dependent oxidoreductase, partial [Corynebacterium sp.]|nr:NAD(P)/FAD-dependent oxidoreductase [Corynebacterium sp.]
FEGIETFPGQVMHAHEFRGAETMIDQDILMIGSSYSAEDIGSQAYKMGVRSVTFSYRSNPMGHDWPEEMEELPLVERFEGSTAYFKNGEKRDFHAVIFCTGYKHHYPFLPSDLALDSANNIYPDTLYRGVVSENNNQMFWLGAQDQWLTFNMFDAQAWYARDIILGRIELPSAEEQREDMDRWLERFNGMEDDFDQIDFQCDYVKDLIEQTDYPMFDLDEVANIQRQWLQSKQDDIMNFRDITYTSVITGTKAAEHHTPWMLELDDSLERYLSEPAKDEAREVFRGNIREKQRR